MQDRLKFRYVFEKDFGGKTGMCYKMPLFDLCDAARSVFENTILSYTNYGYKLIATNQCTGLKDKNGKLIYQGDILKETYKDDESGKEGFDYTLVKWEKTEASFIMYRPDLPHDVTFFGDVFDDGDNTGILKNFEVVGNIYENAELLEEDCVL